MVPRNSSVTIHTLVVGSEPRFWVCWTAPPISTHEAARKGRDLSYSTAKVAFQQMASPQTSSEPEATPSLSPLPLRSCESVRVSQQMASPQLSSSPPRSCESVRVSQQIASPQTSSEPESTPSNAKTIRSSGEVHLEDYTEEEIREISERVVQKLLLTHFGKLERKF
jgi:hypothetical protein